MFSDRLKKWIYKQVKDDYLGDINRDIDLFEKSLLLKAPEEALEGINEVLPAVLERMSDTSDCSQESIDSFVKIEPFLRHLLGVLYPERYRKAPKDEPDGLQRDEWTFEPLLKQAFEIVPRRYNLKYGTPNYISFPYKTSYDLVYTTRNSAAHSFADMSERKKYDVIAACLIVYLDVSAHLCFQIEEAYSKESVKSGFLATQYCRGIIHSYNLEVTSGFTYVDIKWKADNSSLAEYSTVENIMNDCSNNLIKILGEAGSGKTTILKQLVFLSAEQFLRKESTILPVFIQLGSLEIDSSLNADIKSLVCNNLDISIDLLEEMLSINTIQLYLDGFNEILDIKAKKQMAWSIDKLSRQYPRLRIYLTDRSLVKSSIDTLRNALTYRLYPLDNDLKRKFISENCTDLSAKEILLKCFDVNPNYWDNFNTPIKLKQLIWLTTHYQRIPEDFCGEYIRFLFDREIFEKKDENVEYLETFASALAIAENESMTEYQAEACIAKCKQILGYTIPDSRKCLRLLIEMGILILEDGFIEFAYSSYRDYFWMVAFDKHLEDFLGGN